MSSEISFYVPVMTYMAKDVVIGNLNRLGQVKDIRFVEKQIPDKQVIDCFVDYYRLYANFADIPHLLANGQSVHIELVQFITDFQPQFKQYISLHFNTGRKVSPGERKECIQIVEPPALLTPIDPVPKSNQYFSNLMNGSVILPEIAKFTEQDFYNMDEIDAYLTQDIDLCMQKELEMEQDMEDFWDDIDGINAFLEEQQISQYIASLVM